MEGRIEDKRGGEIKQRMSHGHTQWSNVPHKASQHTETHTHPTTLTHTHTSPELHRAPPGKGCREKAMDVHLPANRGHAKRDRGKDNGRGGLRSSDRASPAGGDVPAWERRAEQRRKDDAWMNAAIKVYPSGEDRRETLNSRWSSAYPIILIRANLSKQQ